MPEPRLTTSWDDGHPLDLRLADRLTCHGIAATFYVPVTNAEGRPVLHGGQLRDLAAGGFEIASHTHDHLRLDTLDDHALMEQLRGGKSVLEQCLGRAVTGFCHPGGRGVSRVRRVAPGLGLTHARTVEMFRLDTGTDPFALPTTLQFHPHGIAALLRNLLRQGNMERRLGLCLGCCRRSHLEYRLDWLIEEALRRSGVLHVWGHSWEIEEQGLWPLLDRFLARAAGAFPPSGRCDNAALLGGGGPCAS